MSYQVLARKWRPQVFEDVVGQSHVTRTLQNAIVGNRLAHAFLFSGPRGVGKTTTARILAKALNCATGPTPTPCGTCSSCQETAAGTAVDVIEIDGASNRGIEHIRELRETVKYAPAGGKHKVYVIDEVHMLTNEAFNALLKTLEEPPPSVLFIFATTEPQKIPATIHSRCQRYGFKRISLQESVGKLREIAGKEGITVSDSGLGMIARAAEGSMRDSLSLLDQAVSYSGTAVRDEDLQAILGIVPQEQLASFVAGFLARDAGALIRQVDEMLEHGQDMRQFLAATVERLRHLLVIKAAKDPARIIELPAAELEAIAGQAASAEREELVLLFDGLFRTLEEMRWSPQPRYTFEVGIIKACSREPFRPLADVLERLDRLAVQCAGGVERAAAPDRPQNAGTGGRQSADLSGEDPWKRTVLAVRSRRPSLGPMLDQARVLERTGETLVVGIPGPSFHAEQVGKSENRELLQRIASDCYGQPLVVSVKPLPAEPSTARNRPAPAKSGPIKRAAPPQEETPVLKDVLEVFDGTVLDPDET